MSSFRAFFISLTLMLFCSPSFAKTILCLTPAQEVDPLSPVEESGYEYLLGVTLTNNYLKLRDAHLVDFPYTNDNETVFKVDALEARIIDDAGPTTLLFQADSRWSFQFPADYNASNSDFQGQLFFLDQNQDKYRNWKLNCHYKNNK